MPNYSTPGGPADGLTAEMPVFFGVVRTGEKVLHAIQSSTFLVARGIIFIDLAIAQVAALGVIAADTMGWEAQGWLVPVSIISALVIATWHLQRDRGLVSGGFRVTVFLACVAHNDEVLGVPVTLGATHV